MNLQPGTELDRIVGEKLGFEVISEKEDVQRRQQTEHERGAIALYGYHYVLRRKGMPSVTWSPSTSWASMQLVVEEMQRRGLSVFMNNHDREFKWKVNFRNEQSVIEGSAFGDTLPFTIALAALSALEGQADETTKSNG